MDRTFRKTLLLGAGDIGQRILAAHAPRGAVTAVTSTPANRPRLRRLGARVKLANLDKPGTLARLPRAWAWLLHCAPPQASGRQDQRTRNLLRQLAKRTAQEDAPTRREMVSRVVVYLSTSGVYGDCGGARVTERRPCAPDNLRAKRRVDAERTLARAARRGLFRLVILRVPGIYAADRLPLERLRRATPAIAAAEDSYTNHIHADDLAAIAVRALRRTACRPLHRARIYNCNDDSEMKMGDYFDLVADAFELPRPPRLPRAEVERAVSPMLMSFMRESRRLDNSRLKRELGVRFQFPTVAAGVAGARTKL
jgi:nucleoside-diphosphate-sugar epimerase